MIAGLPFTLFISDSHLLSLLTDLRLLLTFKRPARISPFPYTFLDTFQLYGDTQFVAIGQQSLRNTELEVCQQDTELTNHLADMLLPYLLTFLGDREKGIFETISIKYRILCQIVYVLIPTLLFAVSALLTICFSGIWTGVARELIGILILVLLTLVFSQLLIVITKKSSVCIACIPGLLIGCLIFCPVFIQVSNYVPVAEFIEKLFVPYYYLKLF